MNPLIEKGEELARVKAQGLAIVNRCRAEQRGFSGQEKAELDRITRHAADLQAEVDSMNQVRTVAPGSSRNVGLSAGDRQRYSIVTAIRNVIEGRFQGTFEHEVSEATAKQLNASPRGFLVPPDVTEYRTTGGSTQLVGTTGIGGYLVATDLSPSIIDIERNRLVLTALGVTHFPNLVGDFSVPTVTADPSVAWLSEDEEATVSHFHVGQLHFSPKALAGAVQLSRKLILQANIPVENFVRAELAAVLAVEIDRAAIAGTGTKEPFGIIHVTGVGSVECSTSTNANAALSWSTLVGAQKEIALSNADSRTMAWAVNPATAAFLRVTARTTNINNTGFLMSDDNTILGAKVVVSNQLPNNYTGKASGASVAILADWSQFVLASWGSLDVIVDGYTQALSGAVRIVAHQSVDFGLRNAAAFCVISDINPAIT